MISTSTTISIGTTTSIVVIAHRTSPRGVAIVAVPAIAEVRETERRHNPPAAVVATPATNGSTIPSIGEALPTKTAALQTGSVAPREEIHCPIAKPAPGNSLDAKVAACVVMLGLASAIELPAELAERTELVAAPIA